MDWRHGGRRVPALFWVLCVAAIAVSANDGSHHTNTWAVQLEPGTSEPDASLIATELGFTLLRRIIRQSSGDVYVFEHSEVSKKSLQPSVIHHQRLSRSSKVVWAEQQVAKVRVKRELHFNDPTLPDAWYLNKGAHDHFDMKVREAWESGYSGRGAVVTILDDGLEWHHPDLEANYDPEASADINNSSHGHIDPDPTPRYNWSNENRHGTRCAGEVAAVANNGICSVGVAFGAKIGGVRMLDGDVTDSVEAQSLRLNPQHIDIYSASWGPDDNGRTVDGPGALAKAAFVDGIKTGRGGKGSLFVWASGNGGLQGDSCACDGYTNSMYTLSVSSASESNTRPWYLEECASTIATTYSSGANSGSERQIVTTDLNRECTRRHTGTSASAPLAAAIVALVLQANTNLTWRDVQYIVLMSSNPEPLRDGQWFTNGVGRKVSHLYGYGLMDALAAVKLAANWTTVPPRYTKELPKIDADLMLDGHGMRRTVDVPACPPLASNPAVNLKASSEDGCLRFLEHVQLVLTLNYTRRGDLSVVLKSPSGTSSTLLPPRQHDDYNSGFINWPFMSVHFWGEQASGAWTFDVRNAGLVGNTGHLVSYQLVLHGIASEPVANTGMDSRCHPECEPPCSGYEPSECSKCKHYRLGDDGPCVESCPEENYFLNDEDATCRPCFSDCKTCEGEKTTDCLTCNAGMLLDAAGSHLCTQECSTGSWPDPESHECRPCMANCSHCRDAETCLNCAPGFDLLLADGTCAPVCDSGYYRDIDDAGCHMCDATCGTCDRSSPAGCLSCKLLPYLHNGTCLAACPQGFFGAGQVCTGCHPSCLTCDAGNDNNCHSCSAGSLLSEYNMCIVSSPSCPQNHYFDPVLGICSPCHFSCGPCDGPSEHDCLGCEAPWVLSGRRCVESCPSGQYGRPQPGGIGVPQPLDCAPCFGALCRRCTGSDVTDCVECEPPHRLTAGSGCMSPATCGPRSYLAADATCKHCHASCLTCHGSAAADCLSCPAGEVLLTGLCAGSCSAGFTVEATSSSSHVNAPTTPMCIACHSSCRTCSGPTSADCLDCPDGFILKHSMCIVPPKCYSSQYFNDTLKGCLPCHQSCSECTGPAANQCTACVPSLHYYRLNHTCVVCCSSAQAGSPCCQCISSANGYTCPLSTLPAFDDGGSRSDLYDQELTTSHRMTAGEQQRTTFIVDVIVICCTAFVLYGVIFGVLQARTNRLLCWRHSSNRSGTKKALFVSDDSSVSVMYSQVRLEDEEECIIGGDSVAYGSDFKVSKQHASRTILDENED